MTIKLLVNIVIISASDLPKTDRLSSIDGYIVLNIPNEEPYKTKAIDNNRNPKWDTSFSLFLDYNPASPKMFPTLSFELYDKNKIAKDEKVATAELQLNTEHFLSQSIIQIPLQPLKSKYAKYESMLSIMIGEFAYAPQGLYDSIQKEDPRYKDVKYYPSEDLGTVFLTLENFPSTVLALVYKYNSIDVKLCATYNDDNFYIDIVQTKHINSKVSRMKLSSPDDKRDETKHNVYEDIQMSNVPFSVVNQPGMISFYVFEKEMTSRASLSDIVGPHGWKGTMGWAEASKTLTGVELNHESEEIFIRHQDAFVVIDFEKNQVRIKCLILDNVQNNEVAYDFVFEGAVAVKKTSEVFIPPRPILGGKYFVQRRLELLDIPSGATFSQMKLLSYKIAGARYVDLFDLVKLHPF